MTKSFKKGKNDYQVTCDFCEKKLVGSLRISKNNNPYEISIEGAEFHHMDGNPKNDLENNVDLFCYKCHKIIHLWGIIQRWLDKTGKKVENLPDAKKLKPMMYRRY